jgi:hypothetical protein
LLARISGPPDGRIDIVFQKARHAEAVCQPGAFSRGWISLDDQRQPLAVAARRVSRKTISDPAVPLCRDNRDFFTDAVQ